MKNSTTKIFLLTLLIFFRILLPVHAQPKVGEWRWANDSFTDKAVTLPFLQYNKIEHGVSSAFIYWGCRNILKYGKGRSFLTTMGIAVAQEVYHGLVPWERAKFFGGDGFSWRDLVGDALGIFVLCFFDLFDIRLGFWDVTITGGRQRQ